MFLVRFLLFLFNVRAVRTRGMNLGWFLCVPMQRDKKKHDTIVTQRPPTHETYYPNNARDSIHCAVIGKSDRPGRTSQGESFCVVTNTRQIIIYGRNSVPYRKWTSSSSESERISVPRTSVQFLTSRKYWYWYTYSQSEKLFKKRILWRKKGIVNIMTGSCARRTHGEILDYRH